MLKTTSLIVHLIVSLETLHHVLPQALHGIQDCQPLPKDCKPDCITYGKQCPRCNCRTDGSSNSPFNQGTNLYETPYSPSVMSMSIGRPMLVMTPGTGSMMTPGTGSMMNLGGRTGPMSLPFFHRGSPAMTYSCIKGDIVCPAYCLVEDENGCKSCPCGPANGMAVPVISGHVTQVSARPEKPKQTKDCLATIICMLSCKGYKLGPKGPDGCQTCTCVRNDTKDSETNSDKPKNSTSSGEQSNSFNMDNMLGGSSLMFGSGSGSSSGSGAASLYSNTNSQNGTSSGGESSPFHIDKMPGGSSVGFGSGSGTGSGTSSASGVGMPSPFSTGGGGDGSGSNSAGFNPLFPGASMTMDGSGKGDGMGGGGSSGSGSGCVGPFCASSSTQNSGKTIGGAAGGSGSGSSCSGSSCSEKNEGFNPLFPGASMTMSGSGSGGGMGGTGGSDSSGSGCAGPLCMTGGGAGGGTGSGSSCSGPACSAKNGETLLSILPTVTEPVKGASCPNTDLCVRTCKYTVKLGPAGSDGCHSCACVMKEETRPQQKLCDKVVQCIMRCKTGYEVGNSKDQDGCPSCVCHEPSTPAPTEILSQTSCDVTTLACMTKCRYGYNIQNLPTSQCPVCKCLPPPTTPTSKPGVYSILQNCPEAVHCMTTCSHGYSMVTRPGEACPTCHCNTVAITNVQCSTPLSCPRGCGVGYRCGTDGCPVCECIRPTEVGATLTNTYLAAPLVCSSQFMCISRCPFGYQTGHNGCPTCQCLLPVTVDQHSTIVTGSGSALGTTGSSGHAVLQTVEKWSFSQILKNCPEVLQCVATCTSGFEISTAPPEHCPNCLCKVKVPIVTGSVPNVVTGSGHSPPNSGVDEVPAAVVPPSGQQIALLPSPSVSPVTGTGNGDHSPGHVLSTGEGHNIGSQSAVGLAGSGVTDCVGPACSAPNGLHIFVKEPLKKLSPNQCANVLTCVMACTYGYKLGEKADNGCPACECLQ